MEIGVIHATNNAVSPLKESLESINPTIKIINFVDENIQKYANKINGIDGKTHRDFLELAIKAEEAEVDIIVVACTVLTPIVHLMEPFINTPIMAVDRAMLENAVKNYSKIGVVVTNAPTAPATKMQLENLATSLNKDIEIHVEIDTKAMTELKSGNIDVHNHLNYLAAKKLKEKGCEVIILAQITQASAEKEVSSLEVPVLTSPKEAMKQMEEIINK